MSNVAIGKYMIKDMSSILLLKEIMNALRLYDEMYDLRLYDAVDDYCYMMRMYMWIA